MCGIVGYIGPHSLATEKVFLDMLRVDVVRGPHSTGVAFCSDNGAYSIVKYPCLPDDLIDSKAFAKSYAKAWDCYIGHNRFATTGALSFENAHPFHHKAIIGVHNGTLRNKNILPKHDNFEVDSEVLIHSIAAQGIDKTWKNTNGSAAIVWWDRGKRSLNMVRNAERPIVFARTADLKGVFFASEPWIISGCCSRNDVKLDEHIYILNTDKHYSWTLSKKGGVLMTHRKLDPFVFQTTTYHTFNRPYGQTNIWDTELDALETKEKLTEQLAKDNPTLDVTKLIDVDPNVPETPVKQGSITKYDPVTCTAKDEKPFIPFAKTDLVPGETLLGPSAISNGTPSKTSESGSSPALDIGKISAYSSVLDNKTIAKIHRINQQLRSNKAISLYPTKVVEILNSDKKTVDRYRVELTYQKDKSKTAFVMVTADDPHGILDYCPGYGSKFSKVFFKSPVTEILAVGNPASKKRIVKAQDIEVIIPSDAVRTVHGGKKISKKQFDMTYGNCENCQEKVAFEDTDAVTGSEKIMCGDCSHGMRDGTFGQSFSEFDIRTLLEG